MNLTHTALWFVKGTHWHIGKINRYKKEAYTYLIKPTLIHYTVIQWTRGPNFKFFYVQIGRNGDAFKAFLYKALR